MNYRRFKKYILDILSWWDIDEDLFTKTHKKWCINEAKRFKSKKQLNKYLDNLRGVQND